MKIMLVRHGETFWNANGRIQGRSDIELSPTGIEQAKILAKFCPFEKVDAVYSSDLKRAKVTAEILAEKFGLSVELVPELREVSFGDWEGNNFKNLQETEPENVEKFFQRPDELRISNGETFAEMQARAMAGLKKIIAAHASDENSQIIVAAHGAVNRAILCSILEIPIRKMWVLSQFNTAVNILRVDDGFFTVDLINGTAHLERAQIVNRQSWS
ncbi:MAG: histidine phosphatase family protein [Selenomonadaceae bacterium]|nr:histidine phosphatase family protein [Selenomonadaceae bacterium]